MSEIEDTNAIRRDNVKRGFSDDQIKKLAETLAKESWGHGALSETVARSIYVDTLETAQKTIAEMIRLAEEIKSGS